MDEDARRALAWLQRGQLQDEIGYDDHTPKQSEAELAGFQPIEYRRR